jgi:hypothetical protein
LSCDERAKTQRSISPVNRQTTAEKILWNFSTAFNMEELLQFLENYEIWIYVLLGVVGFIYLRKLLVAWQEWRSALFGLERETAQRKLSTAITIFVLLAMLMGVEFFLVSFVAPTYPQEVMLPTPTIDRLATITPTLEGTAEPVMAEVQATATPQIVAGDGCVPGQLEWTYPQPGDEISGAVEFTGTVNLANLGFYKYEFRQAGSDTWQTIAAGDTVKVNESLGGRWNTAQLIPGDYELRLVASDNQNQAIPACEVSVQIVLPEE